MIHIFAGLKVCIHAITPTHESEEFASSASLRIAPASVSTGLGTIRGRMASAWSSTSAIWRDWPATCRNDVVAVESLAPGQEPDLLRVADVHRADLLPPRRSVTAARTCSGSARRDCQCRPARSAADRRAAGRCARSGHVLDHDRSLHGGPRVRTDGEGAVVLHQHRLRAALTQRRHDALPDRLVADEGERSDRHSPPNSSAIIVSTHGIGSPRAAHAVAYVEWVCTTPPTSACAGRRRHALTCPKMASSHLPRARHGDR